jgi:adenine phosphoribosyltransferase
MTLVSSSTFPTAPSTDMRRIQALIRTIPDFPKPGIQFRDVSTLFKDAWGLKRSIAELTQRFSDHRIDQVIAIESRGFILGGAVAQGLGAGLIMARKRGKLPGPCETLEYALEYGTDCIQIHIDALTQGDRCLVIDDLLATGGTCDATCQLVERLGGVIAGCGFIVNLPELKGDKRLERYDLQCLVDFAGH